MSGETNCHEPYVYFCLFKIVGFVNSVVHYTVTTFVHRNGLLAKNVQV
jgi:hypothetical protein